MSAPYSDLNALSQLLWKRGGVSGFCATTLSVTERPLRETVSRLGKWIESAQAPGARPLGIHLEGPFISRQACGAHPPAAIRPIDFSELDGLWEASRGQLKILTVAPETLTSIQLKRLCSWARARQIVLSAGHSRATQDQALAAFDAGFAGVTHAWNALSFHHREPGVLGAALGRSDVYAELIIDQRHVSPTLIRWTLGLHPRSAFVSDCVPAAATPTGTWHTFGDLRVRLKDGACELPDGGLAGGGRLLAQSFCRWFKSEVTHLPQSSSRLLKRSLPHLTSIPLQAIGKRLRHAPGRIRWSWTPGVSSGSLSFEVDSPSSHR